MRKIPLFNFVVRSFFSTKKKSLNDYFSVSIFLYQLLYVPMFKICLWIAADYMAMLLRTKSINPQCLRERGVLGLTPMQRYVRMVCQTSLKTDEKQECFDFK